ncbi:MAG: hypothetical protein K2G24_02645 [Muribaculaceae bacterium]|nr:hypothetical protein [Muribaculaceae bacterium]
MNIRLATTLIILGCITTLQGYCRGTRVDSLMSAIDNGYGNPIEGVWRMTASPESTLAITPSAGHEGMFDIWLLDSPDFRIEPCVRIGQAAAGAENGEYDISLTERPGDILARKRHFIAHTGENAMQIRLQAYRKGKRINIRRLLPYLFRISVTDNSNRPDNHDGLIRIYPSGGGIFTL